MTSSRCGRRCQTLGRRVEAWRALLVPILGSSGSRVLDVGAGTGAFALLLAHLGYRVVGIDGSARMLEHARMKAGQTGLEIEFQLGLAEQLPFRDGTFDAVTSHLLMWTLLEPTAAVAEWRRVVRSGGRVLAVDRAHDRRGNLLDRVRMAVLLRRMRARDPTSYMADPIHRAQLPLWPINDASGYENAFVQGGLSTVQVSSVDQIVRLERRHRTCVTGCGHTGRVT